MPTFVRALDAPTGGHPLWLHVTCGTVDTFGEQEKPSCTGCEHHDGPETWRALYVADEVPLADWERELLERKAGWFPVAEVCELEAIPAGLTADQELRDRGLRRAVATFRRVDLESALVDIPAGATVDEAIALTVEVICDCVLPLAGRFAAWIADGDPAPAQDAAFEGSVSAVEATEPAEAPRVPLRVCQDRERPHGPHRSQFGAFGVQDCPGRSEDATGGAGE